MFLILELGNFYIWPKVVNDDLKAGAAKDGRKVENAQFLKLGILFKEIIIIMFIFTSL